MQKPWKVLSTAALVAALSISMVLPAFAADGDITDTKTGTVYQASNYNLNTSLLNTLVNGIIGGTNNQFAYSYGTHQFGFNSYSDAVTALLAATPGETVAQAKATAATTVTPIVTTTIATVTAVNPTIAVGGTTGFTFANSDGTAATPTGVVYSVTSANASTAFFNGGVFTATAAGTYTVQATIGTTNLTTTVNVFGVATGITLTTSSSTIIANATSKQSVTLNVVDASNNVVTNFNGTVTLNATANGAYTILNNSTGQNASANYVLNVTNGVATFNVLAGSTANVKDTITTSALTTTNAQPIAANVTFGTLAISSTAPATSALKVTSATSKLGVTTQQQTVITVKAVDTTGATVTTAGNYVTLTVTGPGSFSGSSLVQTYTVLLSSGVSTAATIYSTIGGSGNIVVTASATGLTNGSVTIPTVLNTAASNISVTSQAGTTTAQTSDSAFAASTPFTMYTVQLNDTNGNPVTTGSDTVSATDNTATVGGALSYYAVSSTGQPTGSALTSSQLAAQSLVNGSLNFIVMNTTAGSSNPTITVRDTTQGFVQTASYTFNVGAASKVKAVQSTAGTVTAGQSATFTAQLTDVSGNKVAQAGQNVTFTFASNNVSATFPNSGVSYTAQTNASGIASVVVAIPSAATTSTFQVTASFGGNSVNEGVYTVISATNYVTKLSWGTAASTSVSTWQGATAFTPTSNVLANNPYLLPLNIASALGTENDVFKLTVSNGKMLVITGGAGGNNAWSSVTNNSDGSASVTYTASSATTGFALPTVSATNAGTATITITDMSNPDAPTITQSVTVNAGSVSGAQFWYNGKQISSSNLLNVVANTPVALQVTLVDSGNNQVPQTGATPYGIGIADSNSTPGTFSLTSGGAQIYDVAVPAGSSYVTVYYTNTATQAISGNLTGTPGDSAAYSVVGSAVSATAGVPFNETITLKDTNSAHNVDSAVNGTYSVALTTVSSATTGDSTGNHYGYINGTAITSSGATVNLTFTNGVATAPMTLFANTSTAVQFAVSGTPANGISISPAVGPTSSAGTSVVTAAPVTYRVTTPTAITLVFNSKLAASTFTASSANGFSVASGGTLTSAALGSDGLTVTLTGTGFVAATTTVSYTPGSITDIYGNSVATITTHATTN